MLVVEDGRDLPTLPEVRDDLHEELVTRVELLPELVVRVIAVFGNEEHRIDVEPLLATQRLRDGRRNLEPLFLCELAAQVVPRILVVVHPDEPMLGLMMDAIHRISVDEPPRDVIGVRSEVVDGLDRRDALRAARRRREGWRRGASREKCGPAQEFATRNVHAVLLPRFQSSIKTTNATSGAHPTSPMPRS